MSCLHCILCLQQEKTISFLNGRIEFLDSYGYCILVVDFDYTWCVKFILLGRICFVVSILPSSTSLSLSLNRIDRDSLLQVELSIMVIKRRLITKYEIKSGNFSSDNTPIPKMFICRMWLFEVSSIKTKNI